MQLLRGLASIALADAQQLTLLRAVVKGNQPPLIAAIAADTAELYALAGSQVRSGCVVQVTSTCSHQWRSCTGAEDRLQLCMASLLLLPCVSLLQLGSSAVPGAAASKLAQYAKYKQVSTGACPLCLVNNGAWCGPERAAGCSSAA